MRPPAAVEFAHQDVQFAKGRYEGEDEDAYFVQENLAWGSWHTRGPTTTRRSPAAGRTRRCS
ncbi:MAG TPA: hypothetical protein ENK57_09205 [Polyangiaceae bacterium]|nr:hypothetical protein [Polyangiaceae bacterium]